MRVGGHENVRKRSRASPGLWRCAPTGATGRA